MRKEILRSELLGRLSALTNDEIQSFSFSLTNQIIKFFELYPELSGRIGAGYLPLKAEIAPVYQVLLQAVPLMLAYPMKKEGNMGFAIPDGMPRGGIWLDPPFHEVQPEWFFVPGVGFDLAGNRLGRGKGFYDRYFEDLQVMKIGIAWSEQLKDKIPVESHDCHMDFIITENFCWNVKQQVKF